MFTVAINQFSLQLPLYTAAVIIIVWTDSLEFSATIVAVVNSNGIVLLSFIMFKSASASLDYWPMASEKEEKTRHLPPPALVLEETKVGSWRPDMEDSRKELDTSMCEARYPRVAVGIHVLISA